ncbi:hypothetical protein RvY_14776 [Ramazzottius varieornatus]|uniref:Uncharacterized protein n=1 Tax=Ramazzottius varieornatus TaxID=947166 RepID=A0A1D1VSG8_RAMVA|nr:hypothetical protein RvY_14776 [Ramazzottius varieornatus]
MRILLCLKLLPFVAISAFSGMVQVASDGCCFDLLTCPNLSFACCTLFWITRDHDEDFMELRRYWILEDGVGMKRRTAVYLCASKKRCSRLRAVRSPGWLGSPYSQLSLLWLLSTEL